MKTKDYLCSRDVMGIYDSEKMFSFGIDSKKAAYIGLAALSVVFVVLLAIFLSSALNQAIEARFQDNPLLISQRKYTLLEVKVTNVTDSDARGVEIVVSARDKSAIAVGHGTEDRKTISTIERGQYRILNFLVTPLEGINEGSYILDIKANINNKTFTKEAKITVKR
ncbi:MAG: hypothetical protein N3F05_03580 [Candidatus Diapherotrites archaeon]|nr:hypothetical protein [Candidatus Diapherotrites archaeon]